MINHNAINRQEFEFLRVMAQEVNDKAVRLPSFPDVVMRIRDALEKEECDAAKLANLASLDPVLASKLLVAANSAFHNPGGASITDLKTTVMRLGFKEVRNLAIALAVEQLYIGQERPEIGGILATLWRRSVALSSFSYVIAKHCTELDAEQAFLCGLLHEVGKLYILIKSKDFPEMLDDIETFVESGDGWHPQVGKCILEQWEFDDEITNTLDPVEHQNTNVRAAPELVDAVVAAKEISTSTAEEDIDYASLSLQKLGIDAERLAALKPEVEERMQSLMQAVS